MTTTPATRTATRRRPDQRAREKAREELLAYYPALAWLSYRTNTGEAATDSDFMTDMADAFAAGAMTDRQAAAAETAIKRDTDNRLRRAAALAAGVSVPSGTHQITGVIISARWRTNPYAPDDTLKILVAADDGYRVWGTCPRAISTTPEPLDRRITVTAHLSPKPEGDDPLFGYFTRPRAATLAPVHD